MTGVGAEAGGPTGLSPTRARGRHRSVDGNVVLLTAANGAGLMLAAWSTVLAANAGPEATTKATIPAALAQDLPLAEEQPIRARATAGPRAHTAGQP